jgi:enoyl-CoA hydratase/carnithine racemase
VPAPPAPLALQQATIARHFALDDVAAIMASLATDADDFAVQALASMRLRSPTMLCVTLEQLRRGASLTLADCLRMERSMVRHCFERGDVVEGIRAAVIDKDRNPQWQPARLEQVTPDILARYFQSRGADELTFPN